MKEYIITITMISFVIGLFFLALFGEQVDNFMTGVIVFLTLLPKPWGGVICSLAFSLVVTACILRSSREHWPSDTEFQNEDKLPHSED